jgi:hypothetical protein
MWYPNDSNDSFNGANAGYSSSKNFQRLACGHPNDPKPPNGKATGGNSSPSDKQSGASSK